MAKRLSKITTRTGDSGTTGLGDGTRVAKDDTRIEAIGTVDELNSWIGLLASKLAADDDLKSLLLDCQQRLFDLGGELSIPTHQIISDSDVSVLDDNTQRLNGDLPSLDNFILPGGPETAAICHIARTVCRRAERRVVSLADANDVNPYCVSFLNRLSDFLFVVARTLANASDQGEILWEPKQPN
jgi:cob(I)alamin adenosyltransferase|tara:strand:+ start:4396 stop:4950 length:555 start_codon:yes stop_codon:yes gene_type:complete